MKALIQPKLSSCKLKIVLNAASLAEEQNLKMFLTSTLFE